MTVEEIVKRYQDSMTSTATKAKYISSINAVTESPMAKAADRADYWASRVAESKSKYVSKLRAAPMERYKKNATTKGADRLGSGALAAMDKVRAHFAEWQPTYDEAKRLAAGMPKGGINESLDRVRAVISLFMRKAGRAV